MKVYAHRGFSGSYPENTMLAFEKALEAGADGIELDVHLSKDGKPVIIHDELLARTSGRKGLVSDYTLKELEQIEASKTHADKFDATIPSFEEYCHFAQKTALLNNIEIKTNLCWYTDIEKILVEMVRAFHLEERTMFSSFNWLSTMKIKHLAPEIPCALLYEDTQVRHLAFQAKEFGFEYLNPPHVLLNDETVSECKKEGLGLNVWTVNDEAILKKLVSWGVDGVISNFPDMCLRTLSRI